MVDFEKYIGDLNEFKNIGSNSLSLPYIDSKNKTQVEKAKHDLILLSTTARKFITQDLTRFVSYFNTQPDGIKSCIEVIRPYWLGLSNPFREYTFTKAQDVKNFISERLVQDLLDLASSYKLNYDRTPVALKKHAEKSLKGHKPRLFRNWFESNFGKSTFTNKLVKALAEGKTQEYIRKDLNIPQEASLWGFKGEVISDSELETIQDLLASGYIPSFLEKLENNLKNNNLNINNNSRLEYLEQELLKLKKETNN